MAQDTYGVLADDRINDQIDFSNIQTKEDYIKEVKNYLNRTKDARSITFQGKRLLAYVNDMYENSSAKEKVEGKQAEALRQAQAFEKTRPAKRRIPDERRTSRDTRRPTFKNVKRWKKAPSKSDIRGVDTRIIRKKIGRNTITKKDVLLRKQNIFVSVNIRGIKQYRDKLGRFTKKN